MKAELGVWEGPRQLKFTTQSTEEERDAQKENTGDLQRVFLDYWAEYC